MLRSEYVETATDADFDAMTASGRVVVEFLADWCGTCRVVQPWVERMASEFAGQVRVVTVDVDANPTLAARFGVRALPTFYVFDGGMVVGRLVGAAPRSEIESLFATTAVEESV